MARIPSALTIRGGSTDCDHALPTPLIPLSDAPAPTRLRSSTYQLVLSISGSGTLAGLTFVERRHAPIHAALRHLREPVPKPLFPIIAAHPPTRRYQIPIARDADRGFVQQGLCDAPTRPGACCDTSAAHHRNLSIVRRMENGSVKRYFGSADFLARLSKPSLYPLSRTIGGPRCQIACRGPATCRLWPAVLASGPHLL
jgi:hypothetical protein